MAWLIARRAAAESLRDRNTSITNLLMVIVLPLVVTFYLVLPHAVLIASPISGNNERIQVALYVLLIGVFPAGGSVGIAAGVFAGEKEQGNLTPLLASPASNVAIFGGKVLGAILPPMLYATLAEVLFALEVSLIAGQRILAHVSPPVYALMLAMVPCYAMLGAGIASVISSRVRTYSAAQTFAGLTLLPVLGVTFGVIIYLLNTSVGALGIAVGAVALLDIVLIVVGAATWRREEVLAQR
jgi:ABC-type Na+ efflux pump permease subunit